MKECNLVFTEENFWSLIRLKNDLNRWFKVGTINSSRLPKLASLGRRCSHCGVNQPERTIPECRWMSCDHLRARFVKFGEG